METNFIKTNFPRLTSSTRIVLLGFSLVLGTATLYSLFTENTYFPVIFDVFAISLATIFGFFFGQRDQEHKNFAEVQKNILPKGQNVAKVATTGFIAKPLDKIPKIHDINSLSDIG